MEDYREAVEEADQILSLPQEVEEKVLLEEEALIAGMIEVPDRKRREETLLDREVSIEKLQEGQLELEVCNSHFLLTGDEQSISDLKLIR